MIYSTRSIEHFTRTASVDDGSMGNPNMDGLMIFEELRCRTNPTMTDTDRSGRSNPSEIQNGRDPFVVYFDICLI